MSRDTHSEPRLTMVNSLSNGGDSDIKQIENDFKDPEDGFWDENSEDIAILKYRYFDIRSECRFARVQL